MEDSGQTHHDHSSLGHKKDRYREASVRHDGQPLWREPFCVGLLRDLVKRGLKGVKLAIFERP
jgi:hypothetical protein